MINDFTSLDLSKQYSYADYLTWQFKERVELIKGLVFKMSPAPSRYHQEVLGNIHTFINMHLMGNRCKTYIAPFDVMLLDSKKKTTNKNVHTVVQPDCCIICDETKLIKGGCMGSPDMIVEVVSKGNSKRDVQQKFELYQENQVCEYWIVHPSEGTVTVFDLIENAYKLRKIYTDEDVIDVAVLPGFQIDLSKVFS
jgi:Uma2 family endonuclease